MYYNCEECDYDPPRLGIRAGDRLCSQCSESIAFKAANELAGVSSFYCESKKDFLERVKLIEWSIVEDKLWRKKG